jgi:threonine/homoserine/homoserine lactone efflux protein
MNSIAAFALLPLILTLTPGPDNLLVLRSSLRGGRRTGIRVAGGAASGSLFWGLCSAAGLTAIMAASAQAFRAVQLAGAAYLIFLGIRGWRAARPVLADGDEHPSRGPGPGFRAGLLSNLLNPKVGLFFLTVMPQLIPRPHPHRRLRAGLRRHRRADRRHLARHGCPDQRQGLHAAPPSPHPGQSLTGLRGPRSSRSA